MTNTTNRPDLDLDAIEQRANAATPGPWEEHPAYGPHFYANVSGPYLRSVGTLNFGDGEDAEADREFVKHAREDVDAMAAEIRRLRAERDRYRSAWQSARERAQAYGEGIERLVEDRETYQRWLKEAAVRVAELERPAIEAKRNEIRQSFTELIAAAEEAKDYEGAFDVQCRLREREEQWAAENAAGVVVPAASEETGR